jgi:hypothetical protein
MEDHSMNLLDNILGSRGGDYKRPLLELEGVIGSWTAARMRGVSLAGGEVVLARDHLVFSPWDMDKTRAFLVQWLSKAGVPHVGTADKLLSASKLLEPVVLPVSDITQAEILNRASVFKPPQVRLHLRSGGYFDLGILHSPLALGGSPKNNTVFDDFLSKLSVLLR